MAPTTRWSTPPVGFFSRGPIPPRFWRAAKSPFSAWNVSGKKSGRCPMLCSLRASCNKRTAGYSITAAQTSMWAWPPALQCTHRNFARQIHDEVAALSVDTGGLSLISGPLRGERVPPGLDSPPSPKGEGVRSTRTGEGDLGQWRAYADNGRGYSIGFD